MTRKDCVAIAAALKSANQAAETNLPKGDAQTAANYALRVAASNIAQAMATDNGRFDRDRFMVACGL